MDNSTANTNVGRVARINPNMVAPQMSPTSTENQSNNAVDVQKPQTVKSPYERSGIDSTVSGKRNDESSITGGAYQPVLITEVCELPSKGLLYSALGSTLELRAMTTIEERMRLSGENFWSTMTAILNRCKVGTDYDMSNLTDFDFFAALVKLRIISYGNNYKTQAKCLKCGKEQIVNVNLDEVRCSMLEDDFVEPFEIGPLPMSGDILTCRFLRLYDHISISNEVNSWLKKHPNDVMNNPEYTLTMEKMLVTVNGIKLNDMQKRHYVENMVGADSTMFHDKIDNMFYGIHRLGTCKCEEKDCGATVLYQIAPSESFFRATPLDN